MRISDWSSDVCSSDLKILAPQALVVGMMAERERHRDAKLFGPHRDSRQPRTEEIAIFLNERHDVADFLEFLVDPAFLISGRIGREFVMLAARVDRLERGLGGQDRKSTR